MASENSDLLTAGKIAKDLQVSDGKVKKVIKERDIKPEMKKGVCNYYSQDAMIEIKAALEKK
ncbi:MAG TPA: hypothetical protein ENI11_00520 [Actinobacteria bacterium]|nr:hypothetical protein [Actinomycetota bacterium]